MDIGLGEVGKKRTLNGVRECEGQTDKQTNKHKDISTYKALAQRADALERDSQLYDRLTCNCVYQNFEFACFQAEAPAQTWK